MKKKKKNVGEVAEWNNRTNLVICASHVMLWQLISVAVLRELYKKLSYSLYNGIHFLLT
jgi:hypothetical protein